MDIYTSFLPPSSSETTPSPSAMPFNNFTGNPALGFTDYFQSAKGETGFFGGLMHDFDMGINDNDNIINHAGLNSGNFTNGDVISCGGEGKKMKEGGEKKKKKMRKARYAFQTRSQVDILDDGYRWRKYGQKAVKNNKFPRSYYRCTHQGCNVKKQVQRLTGDEGVVVTTYEGVHSHPIQKSTDNFEHILSQMQIFPSL